MYRDCQCAVHMHSGWQQSRQRGPQITLKFVFALIWHGLDDALHIRAQSLTCRDFRRSLPCWCTWCGTTRTRICQAEDVGTAPARLCVQAKCHLVDKKTTEPASSCFVDRLGRSSYSLTDSFLRLLALLRGARPWGVGWHALHFRTAHIDTRGMLDKPIRRIDIQL